MTPLENHGWDRIAKVLDPSRTVARQNGQRSRMASFHADVDSTLAGISMPPPATAQQAMTKMLAEVEALRAFGCPDPLGTYLRNRQRG